MITALVQFDLPSPITLAEATGRFESSAPKYRNLPGLVRKYYVLAEDGRRAGGIYLWESRAAAEAAYNGEWRERVSKLYPAFLTSRMDEATGELILLIAGQGR